jgi:ribosomal-protein-alanine N-acetyltransferase
MVPVTLTDLDDLHRLFTDPDVRRYLWDDQIIPRERAAVEIDASIASFEARGFGMWVLREAGETEIVGFCGLRPFGEPEEIEILYGLSPHVWHRGFAAEASREVLRYGFEALGLERIFGRTDPPNVASRRVLERLGMTFIRSHRLGELDVVEYVIPRAAFRRAG